jgi:hypothetical protein
VEIGHFCAEDFSPNVILNGVEPINFVDFGKILLRKNLVQPCLEDLQIALGLLIESTIGNPLGTVFS